MKKATKKTVKTTKTAKKAQKKPSTGPFWSHLHKGYKIGLTICSMNVPETDIYCLGMSLVHGEDKGTRDEGRLKSFDRCMDGMIALGDNVKECLEWKPAGGITGLFLKLLGTVQEKPMNILDEVSAGGIYGQSGIWFIKGLKDTQKLVSCLRKNEMLSSESQLERLYHQVFFRLPTVVIDG